MNEAYLLFTVMAVFTVASPGPGVLMTLDNAISGGWRYAMAGVCGLALGAAVMASLSSAGVGLLVRSSPLLFGLLKYCGVAYLLYLAWKTWQRCIGDQRLGKSIDEERIAGRTLLLRVLVEGLAMRAVRDPDLPPTRVRALLADAIGRVMAD